MSIEETVIKENVIEGRYIFLKNGFLYSEEVFLITREDIVNGGYLFKSELLSRVPSGEFLKIDVNYKTNSSFDPLEVTVVRSLGEKFSTEQYKVDQKSKQVYYTFDGMDGTHEFERNVSGKFHISTPAFVTAALMTLMKKMDASQTTTYRVLSTTNIWTYDTHFIENDVNLILKSLNSVELKINGSAVMATHCQLFDSTEGESYNNQNSDFYLSKHLNIPYKAVLSEELEVRVDKLKVFENTYKTMFKD